MKPLNPDYSIISVNNIIPVKCARKYVNYCETNRTPKRCIINKAARAQKPSNSFLGDDVHPLIPFRNNNKLIAEEFKCDDASEEKKYELILVTTLAIDDVINKELRVVMTQYGCALHCKNNINRFGLLGIIERNVAQKLNTGNYQIFVTVDDRLTNFAAQTCLFMSHFFYGFKKKLNFKVHYV